MGAHPEEALDRPLRRAGEQGAERARPGRGEGMVGVYMEQRFLVPARYGLGPAPRRIGRGHAGGNLVEDLDSAR